MTQGRLGLICGSAPTLWSTTRWGLLGAAWTIQSWGWQLSVCPFTYTYPLLFVHWPCWYNPMLSWVFCKSPGSAVKVVGPILQTGWKLLLWVDRALYVDWVTEIHDTYKTGFVNGVEFQSPNSRNNHRKTDTCLKGLKTWGMFLKDWEGRTTKWVGDREGPALFSQGKNEVDGITTIIQSRRWCH